MICHYLRKSYFDGRYPVIDRADDMVGRLSRLFESLLLEQRPVILNAPEGQISQEKARQNDAKAEKKDDSSALMHRPFTPRSSGHLPQPDDLSLF